MIADVLRAALEALAQGESFAVATVITARGSSPGKPGHKMLVRAGGGHVAQAGFAGYVGMIGSARKWVATREAPRSRCRSRRS